MSEADSGDHPQHKNTQSSHRHRMNPCSQRQHTERSHRQESKGDHDPEPPHMENCEQRCAPRSPSRPGKRTKQRSGSCKNGENSCCCMLNTKDGHRKNEHSRNPQCQPVHHHPFCHRSVLQDPARKKGKDSSTDQQEQKDLNSEHAKECCSRPPLQQPCPICQKKELKKTET